MKRRKHSVVLLLLALVLVFSLLSVTVLALTYYCGKEEHTHTDDCYETQTVQELACGKAEHIHAATEDEDMEDGRLDCTWQYKMGDDGYAEKDEDGNYIMINVCTKEEHTHHESCYEWVTKPVAVCGKEAHAHDAYCTGSEAEYQFMDAYKKLKAQYPLSYKAFRENGSALSEAKYMLYYAMSAEEQAAHTAELDDLNNPDVLLEVNIYYHADAGQYSEPIRTVSDDRVMKYKDLQKWTMLEIRPELDTAQYFMSAFQQIEDIDNFGIVHPVTGESLVDYIVSDNGGKPYVEPMEEYVHEGTPGIRQPFGKPVGATFPTWVLQEWTVNCHVGTKHCQAYVYYFVEDSEGAYTYGDKKYTWVNPADEADRYMYVLAETPATAPRPAEIGEEYNLVGSKVYTHCIHDKVLEEDHEFKLDTETDTFSTEAFRFMDSHYSREIYLYYDKEKSTCVPIFALNNVDHYAYVVGMPDGNVHPNDHITRAEVATIFFRLFTDEYRDAMWSTKNKYPDVSKDDWFNNAVSTATNAGLIVGRPDGTFNPNGNITRAEFATIAARFLSGSYYGDNMFSDVKGHWAEAYINRAAQEGWIKGYTDGTFRPDMPITRAETMALVNRMLERTPHKDYLLPDMIHWPDNMDTNYWCYADIQEATNSHDYERFSVRQDEKWLKLLENRDWAALEKLWSASNDAPGGDVVDNMNIGR